MDENFSEIDSESTIYIFFLKQCGGDIHFNKDLGYVCAGLYKSHPIKISSKCPSRD